MEKEVEGTFYGNKCYYQFSIKEWQYEDETPIEIENRKCPKCGQLPTKDGHDACLGHLPGVKNACCGHGVKRGYIMFENGITIRFDNMTIDE